MQVLFQSLLFIYLFLHTFQFEELVSQFIDIEFPDSDIDFETKYLNKRRFKAYKENEMIMSIENHGMQHANFYINGLEIFIPLNISTYNIIIKNITDYIIDGEDNLLEIKNFIPQNSYMRVFIPYPTINKRYFTPSVVGFSESKIKLLDDFINNEIHKGFPGAVLLLLKNGKIVKNTAYGYSKIYQESGKPLKSFEKMTNQTLFDLASNTKMYSVLISLMYLYSIGKFNINEKLHKYLSKYSGIDKNNQSRETRTIIELMSHTAGYVEYLNMSFPDQVPPELYCINKSQTQDIILTKLPFNRTEGGNPFYSDFDYMILGTFVELLTNQSLDIFTEERIYRKLGLNNTMFKPLEKGKLSVNIAATTIDGDLSNNTVHFPRARNYTLQGEVNDCNAFHCMEQVSGHAGLFSNTEDLAVLIQMLLNKGGYGNNKFWNKTIQEHFLSGNIYDQTFGWGWRRQYLEGYPFAFGIASNHLVFGHTGWTGTLTLIDPENDLGIILLTNKKHTPFIGGNWIGDNFNTSRYGNIVQLVYEALNEQKSNLNEIYGSKLIIIALLMLILFV